MAVKRLSKLIKTTTCSLSLIASMAFVTQAQATVLKTGDLIPNRFIVTLDQDYQSKIGVDQVSAAMQRFTTLMGGGVTAHVYEKALQGGTVFMTSWQARMLAKMPGIEKVEQDRVVTMLETTQNNATWGLDRIDQADLPLNQTYDYPSTAGSGVNVYILDTGIRATHEEFTGRLKPGRNFAINGGLSWDLFGLFDWMYNTDPENTDDCNGHGTHVASTSAGTTYGVAKNASVIPVRVLNCRGSGSNSGVIAGVDWVAQNHVKPAVANMSLGGGDSSTLDTAVENAIASGVTFVVAAGNDNRDACTGSPNSVPAAITVGSSTESDSRSSFSNYGSCVDIFAPGSDITAASVSNDTETETNSGTSMAAPHVAGAAALLLGENANMTSTDVDTALKALAVNDKLTDIGAGSPNRLLNVDLLEQDY